ncbi:transposase [Phormidium sp. FACHB-1136]|uniref:transposase n=1 Tax=Phormidium sp. FACHB-1136 TaxID=2692848 RepID=UPI001685D15C|nr:transposase [Phormidium sp. FACHB-1136]MBD2425997.1 transposase [Phormidium sp. FACHB-1136]
MARSKRSFKTGFCYHVTVRCNNREFRLIRDECREILLYALERCKAKYGFKLYGLCIMSNHVHYLLEPKQPDDLPKIMHWLNWYTAMCFNRMSLELCAEAYRKFCKRYKPKPKPERRNTWGSKKLAAIRQKMKAKKKTPGQKSLWDEWQAPMDAVQNVAKKFVLANCLNPDVVSARFEANTT